MQKKTNSAYLIGNNVSTFKQSFIKVSAELKTMETEVCENLHRLNYS